MAEASPAPRRTPWPMPASPTVVARVEPAPLGSLSRAVSSSPPEPTSPGHLEANRRPRRGTARANRSLLAGGAEVEGRMPLGRARLSLTSSVWDVKGSTERAHGHDAPHVLATSQRHGDGRRVPVRQRPPRHAFGAPGRVGRRCCPPRSARGCPHLPRAGVRANVGQTHHAPSLMELYVRQGTLLPNPDLRPERAISADVALAHRTEHSRVRRRLPPSTKTSSPTRPIHRSPPSPRTSRPRRCLEAEWTWRRGPTSFLSGSLAYVPALTQPPGRPSLLPSRPAAPSSPHPVRTCGPGATSWLTGRAGCERSPHSSATAPASLVLLGERCCMRDSRAPSAVDPRSRSPSTSEPPRRPRRGLHYYPCPVAPCSPRWR